MKEENSQDALMRSLKDLAVPDHDSARARTVRNRAVELLARRRGRTRSCADLLARYWRFAEPGLVGALSLGFAAWAVTRSIEVLHSAGVGFFRP